MAFLHVLYAYISAISILWLFWFHYKAVDSFRIIGLLYMDSAKPIQLSTHAPPTEIYRSIKFLSYFVTTVALLW